MRSAAAVLLAALVLVPASAGMGTGRPGLALTATPARLMLEGSGSAVVRVTNPGRRSVVVDVGRARFSLDRDGGPKVGGRGGLRTATSWLAVRPRRFVLRAGASRLLAVRSRLPRRVEPGDHDALVLLTTRPRRRAAVAVRMRIGVLVVVRAPGRVVRRLVLRGLRVHRVRRARVLELAIANRGNVTETLGRGRVQVVLRSGSRRTTLRALPRELRPRTGGIVQIRYRGRLRGRVTARVQVAPSSGERIVRRTFRIRL